MLVFGKKSSEVKNDIIQEEKKVSFKLLHGRLIDGLKNSLTLVIILDKTRAGM